MAGVNELGPITWSRKESDSSMQPEMLKVPRGLTAAQLRSVGSSDAVEGKGGSGGGEGGGDKEEDELFVNVNMEMVPPDTPLNEGDMLFLE